MPLHPSVADYPNLLHLKSFDRDLNYTGFISEGWNDPINLLPLPLAFVCLINGWPRGFLSLWVLINTAIIHPMDMFVGFLGWGPKYLSDEYAVLDSRYWPLQDPVVAWISYVEFVIMVPLCIAWYRGLVLKKWYRHFFGLVASTFQLMGTILYMGCEASDGYTHIPAHDWPPTFDSYLKLKYFWFVYVGLNTLWLAIPVYVIVSTFTELKKEFEQKEKQQ